MAPKLHQILTASKPDLTSLGSNLSALSQIDSKLTDSSRWNPILCWSTLQSQISFLSVSSKEMFAK